VLLAAAAFPALAPRLLLLAAILAFFSLDDAVTSAWGRSC